MGVQTRAQGWLDEVEDPDDDPDWPEWLDNICRK